MINVTDLAVSIPYSCPEVIWAVRNRPLLDPCGQVHAGFLFGETDETDALLFDAPRIGIVRVESRARECCWRKEATSGRQPARRRGQTGGYPRLGDLRDLS